MICKSYENTVLIVEQHSERWLVSEVYKFQGTIVASIVVFLGFEGFTYVLNKQTLEFWLRFIAEGYTLREKNLN